MATYWNLLDYPGFIPGATTNASEPLPGEEFSYNPETVGKNIAQYYATALEAQPGYEAILRNIQGVVSPEVRRTIAQAAAERGVGIGSYGGANDATALLRALGLTSQDLSARGIEQFRQAYATIPALSPSNLFVTPAQQAQMSLSWRLQQAELAEAARRQRESLAAQEKLARMGQATDVWQTQQAANLRMWEEQQRQAAAQAQRSAITDQLASLGRMYGTQSSYAPTFPGASTITPTYTAGGALTPSQPSARTTYGTGGYYAGTELPGYEAEQNVLAGLRTPESYGATPKFYVPGGMSSQQTSDAWLNDFLDAWVSAE